MARGALDSAGHPAREGRHPGPHRQAGEHEPGHRWWQVGCLTRVDEQEYRAKWREEREVNRIPEDEPTVFLEVSVADASEFEADLEIRGEERFGYKVLTVSSTAVPKPPARACGLRTGGTPATPELQPCRYWLTLPGEGS